MFSLYHLQMDTSVLVHCAAMCILVVMVHCVSFVGHIFAVIIITKFVANLQCFYVGVKYIKNYFITNFIDYQNL